MLSRRDLYIYDLYDGTEMIFVHWYLFGRNKDPSSSMSFSLLYMSRNDIPAPGQQDLQYLDSGIKMFGFCLSISQLLDCPHPMAQCARQMRHVINKALQHLPSLKRLVDVSHSALSSLLWIGIKHSVCIVVEKCRERKEGLFMRFQSACARKTQIMLCSP